MRVICVDDERLLMEDTVALCLEIDGIDEAKGFTQPKEALRYLEHERVDAALLDIDMPGMNGIDLAAAIKEKWPDTAIFFLTGYPQYALDAFEVHANCYLLKPIKKQKLEAEFRYLIGNGQRKRDHRVEARAFGNFDLMVDGKPVAFKRAKSKELLAYLIDRRGASVTRREAFAVLWEDRAYDRLMQKQLDEIIRSLRATLADYGIDEIFEMQSGTLRVNPDFISCDAWRYLSGEKETSQTFHGEYMSNYSWASLTESRIAFGGRKSREKSFFHQ